MGGTGRFRISEESEWIQAYLDTNESKYLAGLYESYKQQGYIQCLKLVRNSADAQDLSSETFIRAFDRIAQFKIGSPFYPWLNRIAMNLSIDFLRQQSKHRFQQVDNLQLEDEPVSFIDENEQSALKARLLRELKKLRVEQRRCFCLFYINKLSYKDISKLIGMSDNQVRSHIQNARRRLKILMEQV